MDPSEAIAPVYPGHAVVLALQAMRAFSSAREALEPTGEHNTTALVVSSAVDGAGDGAHAAANLIRKMWHGDLQRVDAFYWGQGEWTARVAGRRTCRRVEEEALRDISVDDLVWFDDPSDFGCRKCEQRVGHAHELRCPHSGIDLEKHHEGLQQALQLREEFYRACADWDWSGAPLHRVSYEVTFQGYAVDMQTTSTDDAVTIIDEMTDGLRDAIVHPPGDRGTSESALDISWRAHTRPEAERIANLAGLWFRQKGWTVLSSKMTTETPK